jgi:hypothetical protein
MSNVENGADENVLASEVADLKKQLSEVVSLYNEERKYNNDLKSSQLKLVSKNWEKMADENQIKMQDMANEYSTKFAKFQNKTESDLLSFNKNINTKIDDLESKIENIEVRLLAMEVTPDKDSFRANNLNKDTLYSAVQTIIICILSLILSIIINLILGITLIPHLVK